MLTVLHFVLDADNTLQLVRTYREAMCSGSYLAISHGTTEGKAGEHIKAAVRVGRANRIESTMRGTAELIQMFEVRHRWSRSGFHASTATRLP